MTTIPGDRMDWEPTILPNRDLPSGSGHAIVTCQGWRGRFHPG